MKQNLRFRNWELPSSYCQDTNTVGF